jgi:uncharacterized SAM-binding protein YcdF (DUF218 family)
MIDSIFYFASKLLWLLISPDSLLVVGLCLLTVLIWLKAHNLARWLATTMTVACLLLAILPIGEWVLYPLESRFMPVQQPGDRVDGIIVLGGVASLRQSSQWHQTELSSNAERYIAFGNLARQYPLARLVFTGGAGAMDEQAFKEADLARVYFDDSGLDVDRIIFERESRNTIENATLTKALVAPQSGENWLLITSAYHMPRAVGIFCQLGWPVTPYPVDHNTNPNYLFRLEWDFGTHLNQLVMGTHEWTGLLAYRITGKTSSLFPSPTAPCS